MDRYPQIPFFITATNVSESVIELAKHQRFDTKSSSPFEIIHINNDESLLYSQQSTPFESDSGALYKPTPYRLQQIN